MLAAQIQKGVASIEALELIPGDDGVVLGVRSGELQEIGEVPLSAQLSNAFGVDDGHIVSVQASRTATTVALGARSHAPVGIATSPADCQASASTSPSSIWATMST